MPSENNSEGTLQPLCRFITADILRRAIWAPNGPYCNWIDPSTIDSDYQLAQNCFRPCGLDLYGGIPGILLFLSAMIKWAPDLKIEDTIKGGLRTALYQAQSSNKVDKRAGFFAGAFGSAVAIRSVYNITQIEDGQNILNALLKADFSECTQLDVLNGVSGLVLGAIYSARQNERKNEILYSFHNRILEKVKKDWKDHLPAMLDSAVLQMKNSPTLGNGLGHGPLGFALALLSLGNQQQDTMLKEHGQLLLRNLQREWTNNGELDLRSRNKPNSPSNAPWAWCGGLSGTASALILAAEESGGIETGAKETAHLAICGASDWLMQFKGLDTVDWTLCHGLCGLVEAINRYRSSFGSDAFVNEWEFVVSNLVRASTYDINFLGGTGTGDPANGLMLGNAGIGLAILRIFDHSAPPSPLFLFSPDPN